MRALLEIFLIFALFTLTVYVLTMGSDLLIPIVIATLIWYLIISLVSAVAGVSFFGWQVPYFMALVAATLFCVGIIYSIFTMLLINISDILAAIPIYHSRLENLSHNLFQLFGMENLPDNLNMVNQGSLVNFITAVAQTLTSITRSTGIICIYVLFLLLEGNSFDKKLASVIRDEKKLKMTQRVIKQVSKQTQSYIRIQTLLSLFAALTSYLVMYLVGVDFAGFWAQLIFLFHYIPAIGPIIATILPCLITIVQFDTWYPFITVTTLLVTIQFTIGNILEPKLIGKSINLSGLVIIVSLAVWAKIWGVAGMFLCVPMMVILNIIFSNFEKTRPISIMLSSNGEIDPIED